MNIPKYNTSDFDPIAEFGFLRQNSVSETAPMHTHDFFEIFLVTDGKALHLVNDYVQNIQKGDLVLIRPNDIHCYDFYQSFDFKFINIAFSVDTFTAVCELFMPEKPFAHLISSQLSPTVHLSQSDAILVEKEMQQTFDLCESVSPEYARCYFRSMLSFVLCKNFFFSEERSSVPKWLVQAVSSMRSIANFQKGLSKMIELCNCTEEHLCREFKKHYKTTPVSFINKLRLEYAGYLLCNTQDEIIDICEQCGFGSLSHFYHLFRNKFGCSPKKYRELSKDKT